ncbi:hypothetical protein FACUT_159 [Fusarium acutatum]|uniref:Uncharacterized protein n=1 Tax=Fusarium acutatum TaxID=78861 RepID=A0A8H4K7L7_9HYPO|nr:hypothetical protein FACUT_159 [Fusarium acutatum]
MQETEFKRWGFVIFRSVYIEKSQTQWKSYIVFFRATVEDKLKHLELWTIFEPHLEWIIMEDCETLNNASKKQVRDQFSQWVSERSVERDGTGAEDPLAKCLDTVDQYTAWVEAGAEGHERVVVCVVLDGKCGPRGRGRDGFPSIEGCTKEYIGWIYTGVEGIPERYNSLFHEELEEQDAPRPPGTSKTVPTGYILPFENSSLFLKKPTSPGDTVGYNCWARYQYQAKLWHYSNTMRHLFAFGLGAAAAYLLPIASGQQLGFRYPYETMTLSDSCLRMLNTNVTECSPGLFYHAPIPDLIFKVLVEGELVEIYHQNCDNSLIELRPKIQAACNTDMDAVAFLYKDKNLPTPGRATGKLCDLQIAEWRGHRESDKPLECQDFLLAPLKMELEAGISYKDEDASEFEDITSSCNATGYEYTKPAPYATTLTTEWWATMAKSASVTPADTESRNRQLS